MSHVTVLDNKQNHFLLSPKTQRTGKHKGTIEPGNTVLTNEFGTQAQDRQAASSRVSRLSLKNPDFFRFLERLEIKELNTLIKLYTV